MLLALPQHMTHLTTSTPPEQPGASGAGAGAGPPRSDTAAAAALARSRRNNDVPGSAGPGRADARSGRASREVPAGAAKHDASPGDTSRGAGRPATALPRSGADPQAASFDWVVAVDPDGDCRGALELAGWLAEAAGGARHRFTGLLTEEGADARDRARAVLRSADFEDLILRARPHEEGEGSLAERSLARASGAVASDVDTPEGAPPGEHASASPAGDSATGGVNRGEGHPGTLRAATPLAGLIVSRRADAEGPSLVRLGGELRRLADASPVPVAIAPHDLERRQMSHGPVLLAVDPAHTPAAAARFAQHLAQSKGLDLLLVHVTSVMLLGGFDGAAELLADAYVAAERTARDRLERWARAQGLGGARGVVARGDVRFAVQTLAKRHDASLIVCGTRQRGVLDRLLEPSRALELARYARRPVILVPRGP